MCVLCMQQVASHGAVQYSTDLRRLIIMAIRTSVPHAAQAPGKCTARQPGARPDSRHCHKNAWHASMHGMQGLRGGEALKVFT